MKKIAKSQIIFMIIFGVVTVILSLGTSYAANVYLYDSKDVSYNNTTSGIVSTDVQGAIDEVYAAATDYNSMNTRVTNIESQIYPVGSIYISVNNTNPSTIFGGTWERFGKGKTLVGLDENDTDYDTSEGTGGAKSVTISTDNLPVHNHSIPALSGSTTAANSVGSTTTDGSHTHIPGNGYSFLVNGGGTAANITTGGGGYALFQPTSSAGSHSHKLNVPSLTVTTTASNTNGCTNCNATALSTKDPYITVYMWKRIA